MEQEKKAGSKFLGFIAGFILTVSTQFDNGIYYYIFSINKSIALLIPSHLLRYVLVYILLSGIVYLIYRYFRNNSPDFARGTILGWKIATLYLCAILIGLYIISFGGIPLS